MSVFVVDASVVVKALLQGSVEDDHSRAVSLWTKIAATEAEVLQPPHWLAEVAGALARLSPTTASLDVTDLHAMEIPTLDDAAIYRRACDIAIDLHQHVFDSLYHAVALASQERQLITADERYFRKAEHLGQIIRLRDFELTR